MRRSEWKHEVEKGWRAIGAVFDEGALQLHLAGMDAKDAWHRWAHDARAASRRAIDRATAWSWRAQWPA
jgi:hypothetical protein